MGSPAVNSPFLGRGGLVLRPKRVESFGIGSEMRFFWWIYHHSYPRLAGSEDHLSDFKVISCFPFGRDLQASNRGTMLTYNFVEAFPWPSLASSVAQEKDVTDALLLNGGVAFKNLSSLVAEMPGISIQMLKLRSAAPRLTRRRT